MCSPDSPLKQKTPSQTSSSSPQRPSGNSLPTHECLVWMVPPPVGHPWHCHWCHLKCIPGPHYPLMIHFQGPVSFPSKHHLRVPPPLSTRRQSCHLVTSITILDVGIDTEGLRISTVALIYWGPCGFSSSLPLIGDLGNDRTSHPSRWNANHWLTVTLIPKNMPLSPS